MAQVFIRSLLAPTALLLLMTVEGCICEMSGVNRGDMNLIGLDREWALGEQLADEILQQAQAVRDPVVQPYVEQMGEEIASQTELGDRPWTFHVLRDTSLNAFNIPGGHVFVNSGLIAAARTPSELAGVMAHEIAHGVARHSTEQMTKAYGINLVLRLVAGGEVTILEQIAAELLGSGAMAKFSRDDEREADRLGLEYAAGADYDARGMAAMFESMLALRERRPNMVEQFFSTHPLTEERIEEMETLAGEFPHPAGPSDREAFARVKARVGDV